MPHCIAIYNDEDCKNCDHDCCCRCKIPTCNKCKSVRLYYSEKLECAFVALTANNEKHKENINGKIVDVYHYYDNISKCAYLRSNYKEKGICFNCRKEQVIHRLMDFISSEIHYDKQYELYGKTKYRYECNKCHKDLCMVDERFRVPKKNKIKKWNQLKKDIDSGKYNYRLMTLSDYNKYTNRHYDNIEDADDPLLNIVNIQYV